MPGIEVFVNGAPHPVPEGQTVLGLLESLQLNPARVAVELDGQILKQSYWKEKTLQAGSRLEIVHFVGGG
jgi:thiamine biosynthesis protein ThiS